MARKCGWVGGVCGRSAWGGCGASEGRTCPNLLNARSIEQVFDGAACVQRFGNLLNRCEHLTGAVAHQTILVRHAIQSVDARRGGALEVKKTPAQCCERLTGHEGAMFQRVRLAGPIPRQCPLLRLQPSPVLRMVRRGKAVASRFGGPPCSARDLPKKVLVLCWAFLMMLNRGVGGASAFMGVCDTAVCLKLLSSLSENPSMKLLGVS